jgi:hypothetical protein
MGGGFQISIGTNLSIMCCDSYNFQNISSSNFQIVLQISISFNLAVFLTSNKKVF